MYQSSPLKKEQIRLLSELKAEAESLTRLHRELTRKPLHTRTPRSTSHAMSSSQAMDVTPLSRSAGQFTFNIATAGTVNDSNRQNDPNALNKTSPVSSPLATQSDRGYDDGMSSSKFRRPFKVDVSPIASLDENASFKMKNEKRKLVEWGETLFSEARTLETKNKELEKQLQEERRSRLQAEERSREAQLEVRRLHQERDVLLQSNKLKYESEVECLNAEMKRVKRDLEQFKIKDAESMSKIRSLLETNAELQSSLTERSQQLESERHKAQVGDSGLSEVAEAKAFLEIRYQSAREELESVRTVLSRSLDAEKSRRVEAETKLRTVQDSSEKVAALERENNTLKVEVANLKQILGRDVDFQSLQSYLRDASDDSTANINPTATSTSTPIAQLDDGSGGPALIPTLRDIIASQQKLLDEQEAYVSANLAEQESLLASVEKERDALERRVDSLQAEIVELNKRIKLPLRRAYLPPDASTLAVESARRLRLLVESGSVLQKLSYRNAVLQPRFVRLSPNMDQIQWGVVNKNKTTSKFVTVSDVIRVDFGYQARAYVAQRNTAAKGRAASAMGNSLPPYLCFSVILRDRTLDFIAPDDQTVERWVLALNALVAHRPGQDHMAPSQWRWRKVLAKIDRSAEKQFMSRSKYMLNKVSQVLPSPLSVVDKPTSVPSQGAVGSR
eukprot:GILK01007024.1.p1 GENE.GILK01007024.1~~GILK01007024.1.p1  ORF type:complete len:694 (+),score=103.76 GILK01007024.1:56-2083(+)